MSEVREGDAHSRNGGKPFKVRKSERPRAHTAFTFFTPEMVSDHKYSFAKELCTSYFVFTQAFTVTWWISNTHTHTQTHFLIFLIFLFFVHTEVFKPL